MPETLPKISLLESKHGEREAILQFPSGNEVMLGRENDRTVPLAEGIVLISEKSVPSTGEREGRDDRGISHGDCSPGRGV